MEGFPGVHTETVVSQDPTGHVANVSDPERCWVWSPSSQKSIDFAKNTQIFKKYDGEPLDTVQDHRD